MRAQEPRAAALPRQTAARRPKAAASTGRLPDLTCCDRAGQATLLLALQRQAGNRAVAELVTTARATPGSTAAGGISLHGEAEPHFDGGTSKIVDPKPRRATGCKDCPPDQGCMRVTGTLVIDYHVDVTIRMPDVPGGLTACQERRVRAFLRDVLGPHEQDHAHRLRTYNGTTSRKFDVTACGQSAVQEKVQEMHETEAENRAKKADNHSLAIDPFTREIDLDCR